MGNDGITYQELGTGAVRTSINQPEDWIDPKIGIANYEVFAALTGDAIDAGSSATGVWLPLSTERIWILNEGQPNQTSLSVLAIQVRLTSGLVLAGPVDYTLRAQVIN